MAEKGLSISPKKKTGRPKGKFSPRTKEKILKENQGKVATSWRRLGQIYGKDDKTIKSMCASIGLQKAKRTTVPKVSAIQAISQRYRSKRLKFDLDHQFKDDDIVMDDECYLKLSDTNNNKYYFIDPNGTKSAVIHVEKSKFEQKIMVWIAISPRGASAPVIKTNSKQNVSSEFYQKFMVQDTLIPFLNAMYPDGDYVFWPDLATAHYSTSTQDLMASLGVKCIDENSNPPNAPELRPIEKFWAHLKHRVYQDGWTATNINQLKARVEEKIDSFDVEYFERLMKNVRQKINQVVRKGFNVLKPKNK